MLLFSEVTEGCSRFLKNQLQLDNCLELNHFAQTHDESDLVSYCDSYILEHLGEIVKQEEFLKVNKEDLLIFIVSDKIGLESEEQVFECIFSWIDHDRSLRSGFFQDLMEYVRFSNISSELLLIQSHFQCSFYPRIQRWFYLLIYVLIASCKFFCS